MHGVFSAYIFVAVQVAAFAPYANEDPELGLHATVGAVLDGSVAVAVNVAVAVGTPPVTCSV